MGTVTVKVTPNCESLISHLPRERGWELISEDYDDAGNGEIVIGFEGYGLTAADMQALNAHPNVISYETAHCIIITDNQEE